jgi:hypothetical protein
MHCAVSALSTRKEREWQLNNMDSQTFIKPDLSAKPRTETPDVPGRLTLEEGVSKYLAFLKAQRSERTWQAYAPHIVAIPAVLHKQILF